MRLRARPEIQRLRALLATLDLSERGDPEQWAEHIIEVYESMAETRKRATTVGLGEDKWKGKG